jgi:catechol 2,3-dioxygenase-like lactoylglutathione lyase family enzyme
MLGDHDPIATVAASDLTRADAFYSDVLGLARKGDASEPAITYSAGRSLLLVYQSALAGSNQATAVNWWVGSEFDQIVNELRSRGVTFEHYDMPGVDRSGDVHSAMGMRMVWFKDPDGNIHSVMDTSAS